MAGHGSWSRKNEEVIVESIRDLKPFKFGSISGVTEDQGAGSLIEAGQETYDDFLAASRRGLAFVVYSYSTPIAWQEKNGNRTLVTHRFSQTTSGAQRLVRWAYS